MFLALYPLSYLGMLDPEPGAMASVPEPLLVATFTP